MSHSIGIVILAAGKGTRMKTDIPKALAICAGYSLLDYVVEASLSFAKHSSLKAQIGIRRFMERVFPYWQKVATSMLRAM